MRQSFVFGIDGGGTRSRLAVCDGEGQVVHRAEGGSTNIYSASPDAVRNNLRELLTPLARSPLFGRIAAGCIGSAGLAREAEREQIGSFLREFLPDTPLHLCSDGEILLCGGLRSLEGYALISGTGSLALSRRSDGSIRRSGGFGYMLGDEGSAWWIAHEALVRTLRSSEGRDLPTRLLPRLLAACSLKERDDLIGYVHHRAGKADIGALAPLVTEAAREGDPLAGDVLNAAAEELLSLVRSVWDDQIRCRELVAAGGVLEKDPLVPELLREKLAKHLPELTVVSPSGTALEGACLLARSLL